MAVSKLQLRVGIPPCFAVAAAAAMLLAPQAPARDVYVASEETDSVFIVDSHSGAVGQIPLGAGSAPFALSVTPDGSRVYVSDTGLKAVSVIDAQTNQTAGAPIPVGDVPSGIAFTPDGHRAYVTVAGLESSKKSEVWVIDTQTELTVGAPIKVGAGPSGIAITPDGSHAYVANQFAESVSVIDTRTNEAGAPIKVGEMPSAIAISPDGGRAYVVSQAADSISAIDTQLNQVVGAPIGVGEQPLSISLTADGSRAYVANGGSQSISVVDLGAGSQVAEIAGFGNLRFVAVSPDGKTVYASDDEAGALARIDVATGKVIGSGIPLHRDISQIGFGLDQAPTAAFSPARARPGVAAAFDANGSKDSDGGKIAGYRWDFGDGGSARTNAVKARHVYRSPGTYRVALAVTDDEGCSTVPIFVGRNLSCEGSALAETTKVVRVAYPGVRVGCPKSARPRVCKYALVAVAKRPHGRLKAQSATSRVKVRAGRSAIVSLRPKRLFAGKLAAAKRVLVAETRRIGSDRATHLRRLKIVR
jgi:YVTN family beta-propeller protein